MIKLFKLFSLKKKKKEDIKKNDDFIRMYFASYGADGQMAILDESPRPVNIGDRFYLLKPLKYRQITRLCVQFARTLEKLQGMNLDLTNADAIIGDVIAACEDDFFIALSYVLYFSKYEKEDNEETIMQGVKKEFEYLKDNVNLMELSRCLEVIVMQNDIKRALDSFGRMNLGKKKVQKVV